MAGKRERLQVIHDILRAMQAKNGPMKPTHILYKANLSSQMLKGYLLFLLKEGFIEKQNEGRKQTYQLTIKGYEYLSKYRHVREFMELFSLEESE